MQFTDSDLTPLIVSASPDGELVAIAEGNDLDLFHSDIWTAATGVTDVHQLTSDQASWSPAFSPDSSEIAFMHRVGANPCTSGIWVMNADGTGVRPSSTGPAGSSSPGRHG